MFGAKHARNCPHVCGQSQDGYYTSNKHKGKTKTSPQSNEHIDMIYDNIDCRTKLADPRPFQTAGTRRSNDQAAPYNVSVLPLGLTQKSYKDTASSLSPANLHHTAFIRPFDKASFHTPAAFRSCFPRLIAYLLLKPEMAPNEKAHKDRNEAVHWSEHGQRTMRTNPTAMQFWGNQQLS